MAVTEKELTLKAAPPDGQAAMLTPQVQTATAADLGLRPDPTASVPADVQAKADAWIAGYRKLLVGQTQQYLDRVAAGETGDRVAGLGSVNVGTYAALDVIMISPIQFGGPPPYQPSKIIAGGEFALILAVVFTNPAVDIGNGFAVPASVQLGGRNFRLSFEQLNLNPVSNGPGLTVLGTFSSPAPVLSFIPFFFVAPNPGPSPRLVEMNVTLDITDPAQPWAAFATHHFDVDDDPGFLGIVPPSPPQLLHYIPMRFMVYPE